MTTAKGARHFLLSALGKRAVDYCRCEHRKVDYPNNFWSSVSLEIPRPSLTLFRQPAVIFQPSGNQVHYLTVALDGTTGDEQVRVHDLLALALRHPRPYR